MSGIDYDKLKQLKEKGSLLAVRMEVLSDAGHQLIPLTGRSLAAQQAFMLLSSNMARAEHEFEGVEQLFTIFAPPPAASPTDEDAPPPDPDAPPPDPNAPPSSDPLSWFSPEAQQMARFLEQQLGVCAEACAYAIMDNIEEHLDNIEKLLTRAEANLEKVKA